MYARFFEHNMHIYQQSGPYILRSGLQKVSHLKQIAYRSRLIFMLHIYITGMKMASRSL